MFTFNGSGSVVPLQITNKENFCSALSNIEESWTGRIDLMFSHTFFLESVQLVKNAMAVFEQGYFDCSFYSLRQALEIATTIVYFADDTDENRDVELTKWKKQEKFPMNQQMIRELEKRESVFADMKEKMNEYFLEIELIKQKLNKYVHKQGFEKFYISRAKSSLRDKLATKVCEDFDQFVTKTIGAIAVFRLAVDPFPLLLMDTDIYNRTEQLMTESYTEEFVEKFIGIEHSENYKQTNLYREHYNYFIKEEERSPAVLSVIKNEFINREYLTEINLQKHLLSQNAQIAVLIISCSNKIAKIYCNGGFTFYFTDVHSKRSNWSWNSSDFNNFKDTNAKNTPYDEAFISYIQIANDDYFIEHNEIFSDEELENLINIVNSEIWYQF